MDSIDMMTSLLMPSGPVMASSPFVTASPLFVMGTDLCHEGPFSRRALKIVMLSLSKHPPGTVVAHASTSSA
jgi:hypothetical protein